MSAISLEPWHSNCTHVSSLSRNKKGGVALIIPFFHWHATRESQHGFWMKTELIYTDILNPNKLYEATRPSILILNVFTSQMPWDSKGIPKKSHYDSRLPFYYKATYKLSQDHKFNSIYSCTLTNWGSSEQHIVNIIFERTFKESSKHWSRV